MCTLVVGFYPQTKIPLMIASNRDENPTRPTSSWDIHQFDDNGISSKVYCPIDGILGGTWIGINTKGIFCALTNWDLEENFHGRGLQSRGLLVLNSLKRNNIKDVVTYWSELDARNHKPFNILAGDVNELYNLSCDNRKFVIKKLGTGVHISTGIGFNQPVPRDLFIRNELSKSMNDLSQPIRPDILLGLMGSHNCGIGSEDSICVHDEEHKWETRSTSLIMNHGNYCKVIFKEGYACQNSKYTSEVIELEM